MSRVFSLERRRNSGLTADRPGPGHGHRRSSGPEGQVEWRDRPDRRRRDSERLAGAAEARLRVGNVERSVLVLPETAAAEFTVHLAAGRTCLEAWFIPQGSEKPWLAASVAVERIGPTDPEKLGSFRATHPDSLLR